MRTALVVLLACVAAFWCGCRPKSGTPAGGGPSTAAARQTLPPGAKDLEPLQGTWQVLAIEAAGKPIPADTVQKMELLYIFKGDKLTIRRRGRADTTHPVTVDLLANPKRMVIHQEPPIRAVYAVEGNKLWLCPMVDENKNLSYPTELASRASPKTDLLTMERR